ncbi:oncoprotein-induced transcript 3 protein-like isoform X2 [Haliotis asinina]|uniref:oncoprotein-induced transcript 3 protein-like isoform X2 n=1 Tax=Haliotis asinina TaxID=109174 RepID=UPI003531EF63
MSNMETVSALLLLVFVLVQVDDAIQDGNVSLILGPDTHTGLVQITHEGRTGLVCDDGFDVHAAEIACRQAGYPTTNPKIVVAGKFHALPPSMTYILDDIKCFGNEATLSDCQHSPWFVEDCGSGETVAVFCENNPCASAPCRHNASCTKVTTHNFLCMCASGYTGSHCESDIDECALQNGGCSHQCVNDVGGYHCECPDVELDLSPDHHSCVATGESVSCTSESMTISFDKGHFPGLHAQHVTLTDPTCRATSNGTHVIVTAPLGRCGTKSTNLGGKIMYANVVKSRQEVIDGVISHVRDIEVPFQCIVPLSENLEVPVRIDREVLTFSAEARGQFDARCAIDTTLTFHSRHDDAKVQFSLEAFKYLDNSPAVFLNCDVTVCMTSDTALRCNQNCSVTHRRKRSLPHMNDKEDDRWHHNNAAQALSNESTLSQSKAVLIAGIASSFLSLTFLFSVKKR